jgi:hypothetical protein
MVLPRPLPFVFLLPRNSFPLVARILLSLDVSFPPSLATLATCNSERHLFVSRGRANARSDRAIILFSSQRFFSPRYPRFAYTDANNWPDCRDRYDPRTRSRERATTSDNERQRATTRRRARDRINDSRRRGGAKGERFVCSAFRHALLFVEGTGIN